MPVPTVSSTRVSAASAQPLDVVRHDVRVPAVQWLPDGERRGVVLVCHGGGGHKCSDPVVDIARVLVAHQLAVVAIDGPVHGDRPVEGSRDPAATLARFRAAWASGQGEAEMTEDFHAAVDAALADAGRPDLPVGYVGLSMGTAYGLRFLGQRRVDAAVIGMWGLNYVNSQHLARYAAQVDCPVLFIQRWDDAIFDRPGTLALFDAIGSRDKRLMADPGPHGPLTPEQLAASMDWLVRRLLRT